MKAIPAANLPQYTGKFDFVDEPLISISDYFNGAIVVEPKYYLSSIPGSIKECMLRKSVILMLEKALYDLDKIYTFKVYDAWRPLEVQQSLYDKYYREIESAHPDWSNDMIVEEVKKFVSVPSYDLEKPSVHNTGGAVDLTLIYKETGEELEMGTCFDDFTCKAYMSYFENCGDSKIRDNRRLLYWTMINAGFTNYPSEWWHYDYGDSFWSFYAGRAAKYKGLNGEIKYEKRKQKT